MLNYAGPAPKIARFAMGALLAASALVSTAAHATSTLIAQPAGGAGQYYSHTVTVDSPTQTLAFAFRNDPSYSQLSDISLFSTGGNVLTNGDFTAGTYTDSNGVPVPTGWFTIGQQGLSAAGLTQSGCGVNGMPCWNDGAVGGHDGIAQTISNLALGNYTLSYYLASDPQNNGGNVDTSVFFGSGLPAGYSTISNGSPVAPAPLAGTGALAALAAVIAFLVTRGGSLVRSLPRLRKLGMA